MKHSLVSLLVILLLAILASCVPLPGAVGGAEPSPSQAAFLKNAATSEPTMPALPEKTDQAVTATGEVQPTGESGFSPSPPGGVQVPVPLIDGLEMRQGEQPGIAEYLDDKGRPVLQVELEPLTGDKVHDSQLKKLLDQVYGPDSPYVKAGVYPRFRYPLQGVEAGFYGIDASLTASQVILLKEALELFSRPAFKDMQPELFNAEVAYLPIEKIGGDTAGLTYSGTGVVELDRRDLFGNKYLLASVIAHEGSHVLQGPMADSATCTDVLHREVGDQTIPADFYQWDSSTLLQAIKDGRVGAYHVSLWMLFKLGITNIDWIRQAIQTGTVNGNSVVDCKL